ncbi:hypothetical protein E0W68_12750 [Flavobacterium salilacus subsp. salilacus]|uniref:hypothetical protein n=1 Tax=Flavobacterium TaxID=237 RepID=UPI0010750D3E|nr:MULTISPECIES: hypothetical protein [Flavobacterium]KAF2515815.1 hypothetical protein E0W68_12750 [Flavobacterium salilacus subsp. salilacus]MBE1615382.1 hypothetical protein [Flavobacterium sp. SaA2.13]
MEWISYPQHKPDHSQPYVVSISRPITTGKNIFIYVAYYNTETDTWHKYDGFSNDSIKEIIIEKVIGWVNDVATRIG